MGSRRPHPACAQVPPRGASLSTRLVVLASGSGSLLQALLDAANPDAAKPDAATFNAARPDAGPAAEGYPARVVAVGADRGEIQALKRAEAAGVPAFVVAPDRFPRRSDWDSALTVAVADHRPDLVVCAGFMRILGGDFLRRFAPRVINTHPALLPAFPGAHAVRDALAYGVTVTGATVHCVDAGVDTGPVIAQVAVSVMPGDDEATLHERIKTVERALLVDTVARLAGGFSLDGRKVVVP